MTIKKAGELEKGDKFERGPVEYEVVSKSPYGEPQTPRYDNPFDKLIVEEVPHIVEIHAEGPGGTKTSLVYDRNAEVDVL